MRRTIFGFNQKTAIELGLSVNDLLLLSYIQLAHANPKMLHIEKDGIFYVFLSHSKIHEDIPILDYTEGSLKNKLSQLKKQGIIESFIERSTLSGSRAFYTLTTFATEQLFEDYVDSDEEVIKKLPDTSQKNDSISNSNVTSYNNLTDKELNKELDTILKDSTAEPSVTKISKRKIPKLTDTDIREKEYKEENLRKTENKKMNLYEKCVLEITNFTDDEKLREALKTYLGIRLKMTDKKLLGVGQWKGLLKTLSTLQGDKVAIVERATERGWASFFELKDYQYKKDNKKRAVFAEDYGVRSVRPEDVEGGNFSGQVF